MRLTEKQKRNIERVLMETHDALVAIKEETGLSLSIAAYGNDKEYTCIFVHTGADCIGLDERSEIEGFFKSEKWRKRKTKKRGNVVKTVVTSEPKSA